LGLDVQKAQEEVLDMVTELLSPGRSFELETENQIIMLKKNKALINLLSAIDVHGSTIEFPNFYDIAIPGVSSDDKLGFQVNIYYIVILLQ